MISDLFHGVTCKTCGNSNSSKLNRIAVLSVNDGTDYLCECDNCGGEFVVVYERTVSNVNEEGEVA